MHYVMDIHGNYVKKSGRAPEQPKPGVHDKFEHDQSDRQSEEVPAGPEAPA